MRGFRWEGVLQGTWKGRGWSTRGEYRGSVDGRFRKEWWFEVNKIRLDGHGFARLKMCNAGWLDVLLFQVAGKNHALYVSQHLTISTSPPSMAGEMAVQFVHTLMQVLSPCHVIKKSREPKRTRGESSMHLFATLSQLRPLDFITPPPLNLENPGEVPSLGISYDCRTLPDNEWVCLTRPLLVHLPVLIIYSREFVGACAALDNPWPSDHRKSHRR